MITLFIGMLSAVALLWLWLNVAPTMRLNVSQRLDAPTAGNPAVSDAGEHWPHVVIVAPGRNEAGFLPTTLPQLCEQNYPDYHVVFIDDHSDDATPAITATMRERYPHLIVLRNEIEPPAGWVGKCWAIKRGVDHWKEGEGQRHEGTEARRHEGEEPTSSDPSCLRASVPPCLPSLICFTDADVNWHPLALRSAVRAMREQNADVVSLFPGMVFGSTIERIMMCTLTFALLVMFPLKRAMDPKHPDTLTAGAFILTRWSLYEKIGGHESVRQQVVEDVNLGRNLKAAGGRVWLAFTQDLIYCRMYEGFGDLWEGLTKNAYAGMEYKPWVAAYLLVANLVAMTFTPLYVVASAIWLALAPSVTSGAAFALSAAIVLLQARLGNGVRRNFHLPVRYAWSLPVGAAIYFPIGVASIWRYYRGGNRWKGRSYGTATTKESSCQSRTM